MLQKKYNFVFMQDLPNPNYGGSVTTTAEDISKQLQKVSKEYDASLENKITQDIEADKTIKPWNDISAQNIKDKFESLQSSNETVLNYLMIRYFKDHQNILTNPKFFSTNEITEANKDQLANDKVVGEVINNENLVVSSPSSTVYYTPKPWINPTFLYLTWITVTILFSGLVIIRYMRRDF